MRKTPATIPSLLSLIILLAASTPATAGWDEGVSAFQEGRYQDATEEFRSVVERSPEAPQGHYMLGLSLLRQSRQLEALEPLEKATTLGAGQPDYPLALAQAQLAARRVGDALNTLAAIDAADLPEARRATYNQLLAKAATDGDDPAVARAALRRATDATPDSRELWLARARLAAAPEEAFAALAAAHRTDPGDQGLARRAVARAFDLADGREGEERRRWYREGAEVAERLAAASPGASSYLLAGEARMGAGDYPEAREWIQKSAGHDPADPLPHYYSARLSLATDEPEAALDHLREALDRSPEAELLPEIHRTEAKALRHLERFEEAADAFRRAGDENGAAAMERLAEIQAGNEEWEREKKKCEQKLAEVEELRAGSEDLRGTAGWRQIEAEIERVLAPCEPYLEGR